jgi:hypothetical protein
VSCDLTLARDSFLCKSNTKRNTLKEKLTRQGDKTVIKDRFILGALSGAVGSLAKSLIVGGFKSLGLAEFNGSETAAGMLLPAHKVNTQSGRIVGHITNVMLGMAFGGCMTYALSASGKDKAIIKGTGMSAVFWTFFYGNYANMGGSTVRPALPSTILSNLVGHLGYGVTTSYMITRLGDPALFSNEIPLINTQQENQVKATKHMTVRKRSIVKQSENDKAQEVHIH